MSFQVLTINPGSTSTKIAWFEDENLIWKETLEHSAEELSKFLNIASQFQFRADEVEAAIKRHGSDVNELSAVVGRGGLLRPIPSGVFTVNETMLSELIQAKYGEHASNLGAPIAYSIASKVGCPAFIVDPVVVDELEDIARVTGWPELKRKSIFHALNQKAVARRVARDFFSRSYEEMNFIVAHLGGGISIGAHRKGRVVDVNNALGGEGPMSPERAGTLPIMRLASYIYSSKPEKTEFAKKLVGKGGWIAHLGTNSGRDVLQKISNGDKNAEMVLKATAYQISKWIAQMAIPLAGEIDGIIITGGLAHMTPLVELIQERVVWIAPVFVVPGEDEMLALAEGALRVLRGQEQPKTY